MNRTNQFTHNSNVVSGRCFEVGIGTMVEQEIDYRRIPTIACRRQYCDAIVILYIYVRACLKQSSNTTGITYPSCNHKSGFVFHVSRICTISQCFFNIANIKAVSPFKLYSVEAASMWMSAWKLTSASWSSSVETIPPYPITAANNNAVLSRTSVLDVLTFTE